VQFADGTGVLTIGDITSFAESYLDTGDRSSFVNGGAVVALYPDFSSLVWEAGACAPLVVAGPEIDVVRQRMHALAMSRTSMARRANAGATRV
jgi:hypothetical protein